MASIRRRQKQNHDLVREFNGSISAEHCIGQIKCTALIASAPPVALDLMRSIEVAFDPNGIMNQGKILNAGKPRMGRA